MEIVGQRLNPSPGESHKIKFHLVGNHYLRQTHSFQGLSSEVSEAVLYSLELALAHYQDEQFLNSRPEILGDRYLAFVPTNTVTMRFTITRCFTEPYVHGDGQ